MEHDLSPAFVVVRYHSPYGTHNQTLPTRAWNAGIGTNGKGGYLNWDEEPVDADDMISAFVTLESVMQPSTVVWDSYTIYTKEDADSSALPVTSGVLGIPGTSSLGGWFAAVTHTFNMIDTDFFRVKLVLIEASSGGDFGRVLPADFTVPQEDVIANFTDTDMAWASRAGFRPYRCDNITKDLNDKLRKEYNIG